MYKIFIFLILITAPAYLFGAVDPDNQAQIIMLTFHNAAAKWTTTIKPSALWVFGMLTIIDWVLSFGYMALKGTDFAEVFYEIIRKVIVIGFFLFLFQTVDVMDVIPESMSKLANTATSVNIQPDTILENGFKIVSAIWDAIGLSFTAIGIFLSGVIIFIAFAYMAAMLFVTLVKIYFLIVGAYMVYALGGLTQTRSYSINPLISIIKASMELFFIKLILGLSVTTITKMAINVSSDNKTVLAMIGITMLIASLVYMVPSLVDSLISGTIAPGSAAGLGTAKVAAAGMAGAAGAAASSIVGGAKAVSAAKSLSTAGSGSTLGNLAKAAGKDAISSITGVNKFTAGNMGSRMAGSMNAQTSSIKGATDKDQGSESKGSESKSSTGKNNMSGYVSGVGTKK